LQRFILSLLLLLSSEICYGQWQNPSERYSHAYLDYVDATCPITENSIKHYVYFNRDREAIYQHEFLRFERFSGAQIMYSWAQLESTKGQYDFSIIEHDYQYLKKYGKQLFIQLQDATFSVNYKAVPSYLISESYAGGIVYQRTDDGEPEGWVAKRWNKNVQTRFAMLLNALGQAFDGKIAGINLQESAIGVSQQDDTSFSPSIYVDALKTNMKALKQAFPLSVTLQYANFMPGEWLPWEDHGYLKAIYQYGDEIGVGLAAPDLMVTRKGQLNHAIAMMHEHRYQVPLGIAVQDGNYIGKTNSNEQIQHRQNLVPLLHAFADDFLHVSYMFWVDQAPYFQEDVLACFGTSTSVLNVH
jgi:hypothetical protein